MISFASAYRISTDVSLLLPFFFAGYEVVHRAYKMKLPTALANLMYKGESEDLCDLSREGIVHCGVHGFNILCFISVRPCGSQLCCGRQLA